MSAESAVKAARTGSASGYSGPTSAPSAGMWPWAIACSRFSCTTNPMVTTTKSRDQVATNRMRCAPWPARGTPRARRASRTMLSIQRPTAMAPTTAISVLAAAQYPWPAPRNAWVRDSPGPSCAMKIASWLASRTTPASAQKAMRGEMRAATRVVNPMNLIR